MQPRIFLTLIIVFSVLIFLSLLSLCILHPFISYLITRQTRIIPGSVVYPEWLQPSIPVYIQFYLFNLTNPVEFQAGEKPRVEQLGPYTYRERRVKFNVSMVNEFISYREMKQYYFDKHLSNGTEMDVITGVNLAFVTIADKMNSMPLIVDRLIEVIEKFLKDTLIVRKTVSELLWGYDDAFLTLLSKFGLNIPTTRIGLMINMNNTISDSITIDSGLMRSDMVGRIVKFHGNDTLAYWTTPTANMINGTDGTIFHPFITRDEKPYIFSADLCRSLQFYADSVTQMNQLPVIKFLPMPDTFKSPKSYEKNRGFCLNWPDCYGDGVLDMSSCQPGAPVAMSQPHFLNSDKSYQEAVDGLHPTDEFNTVIYVEPNTGGIIKAEKKMQVNLHVKNNQKFVQLKNLSTVLLPIMFINESVQLNDTLIDQLTYGIIKAPKIAKIILLCIVTFSIPALCFILSVHFYQKYRNSNTTYVHFTDDQTQREHQQEGELNGQLIASDYPDGRNQHSNEEKYNQQQQQQQQQIDDCNPVVA
ncbi:unnamed protein product [Trichobilharzia szidati]|nr:unnamed protein product [Trichobilharzia szidati]